ncbi:MAG: hypothetical protein ACRD5M_11245 [Candidatus Acidiferrales bacterium]
MFGMRQRGSRWLVRASVLLGLFASAVPLYAQGCPLCYQSAASGGAQFIQALRNGILILFFPPLIILGAIFYAAYCKRNQFNSIDGAAPVEFDFDQPDHREESPFDDARQPRLRVDVADAFEL